MPIKCAFRPIRSGPRHFTAKAVGRIFCNALLNGVPEAAMQAEFRKCEAGGKDSKDKSALEAMQEAIATLEQNQELIAGEQDLLQRLLQVLGIIPAIGKILNRIPAGRALRLVLLPGVVLREIVVKRVTQMATQRAANDGTLAVLRRAAANEATFLQRVGL